MLYIYIYKRKRLDLISDKDLFRIHKKCFRWYIHFSVLVALLVQGFHKVIFYTWLFNITKASVVSGGEPLLRRQYKKKKRVSIAIKQYWTRYHFFYLCVRKEGIKKSAYDGPPVALFNGPQFGLGLTWYLTTLFFLCESKAILPAASSNTIFNLLGSGRIKPSCS